MIQAQCSCIAKETGECKHIAAFIHRVNNDRSISKTSVQQEWGFPSINHLAKEKYSRGATVDELFPQKVLRNPPQPLYFTLEDFAEIESPIKKRLKVDNMSEEEQVCIVIMNICLVEREKEILLQWTKEVIVHILITANQGIIIGKNELVLPSQMAQYYNERIILDNDSVFSLCLRTMEQSKAAEWFEARRVRITASEKAHKIKTMTRVSAESLLKGFLNPKILNTESLNYGIENEQKARDCYKLEHDVHVFEIGLFVSPRQAWLGVSVDGIVVNDGVITKIIEIKCPISCKSKPIWDEEAQKFNVGFIQTLDNGAVQLKKNNIYYTQCQLQMYVTNIPICDLFIWSPRGSYTVEVHIDYEFLTMLIPKLENFYFNYYLSALCNETKENETNPNID